MAILWERSAIPWVDGDQAFSGAKAYFFDAGTTTPMLTYTDAAESIPHDHPIVANSRGIFPPIFLADAAIYKFRVLDQDDVTIVEADNVAAPTTEPPEFPDSETQPQYLFQTGWVMMAWTVAAQTGFVRLNGRTIGSAASGATERANADAEALFTFLYNNDVNLAVSGGRGASAAGDWAANKTIALPDFRGRVPGGLDSMGNSAAGRITDAELGADSDAIGSAGGDATHALITAELAAHTHGPGTLGTDDPGNHTHTQFVASGGGQIEAGNDYSASATGPTGASGAHTHAVTTGVTGSTGSGTAHNNLQPTILLTFFIKL